MEWVFNKNDNIDKDNNDNNSIDTVDVKCTLVSFYRD